SRILSLLYSFYESLDHRHSHSFPTRRSSDLMIENPDGYIPAFADAGANWISVHQEACVHLHRTLQLIESHGCQPAVVINPATPVHTLDEVLDMVHHVLVMSVNPGFGAQTFIHGSLNKIKTLAEV